jgi:hypothetical protein
MAAITPRLRSLPVALAVLLLAAPAEAQKTKVFIDQDIGGAAGTDSQSVNY